MLLSFLCWNIRGGLHNLAKQSFVRSCIRNHNLKFFVLVETKSERASNFILATFGDTTISAFTICLLRVFQVVFWFRRIQL